MINFNNSIFCFVFAVVLAGGIIFPERQAFALSPWTEGGKELSVADAEDRIVAALEDRVRPDILDIDKLRLTRGESDDSLADISRSVFGDKVELLSVKHTDVLRKRFEFIMPAVYFTLGALFEQYPDHRLVFLGRDCDLVYDAARLFARETAMEKNLKLLPASMAMLYSIQKMLKEPEPDTALIREYLAQAGITEESIKRGEKFVFIDTGFEGSAPGALMLIIKKLFPDLFGITGDYKLSETFISRLLHGSRKAKAKGLQLEYPHLDERFTRVYSSLSKINPEIYIQNPQWDIIGNFYDMKTSEIAGFGMQMFPAYAGKFVKLARGKSGNMVMVSDGKREDISFWEINPTGYNREGAFACQFLLSETIARHLREDRYCAGRVRSTAISNDPDSISRAA